MRRLVVAHCLGLVLWAGAAVAMAQQRTVVLGIEGVDAPQELASLLTEALTGQVKRSPGFVLVPGKRLEEIKLVFGCIDESEACMARAGRSMQVAKLVWGTLRRDPAGYSVTIKVLDVGEARIEHSVSETLSGTSLSAIGARGLVHKMTREFLPGSRGSIRLTSNVSGARVTLGTQPVGLTVQVGRTVEDVAPGTYALTVTKDGFRSWTHQVTVLAGQEVEVAVVLEAAEAKPVVTPVTQPLPAPSGGDQRQGWKIAFWTTAGLTLGAAAGIVVSGVMVLNKQGEKQDAINAYHDPKGAYVGQPGYEPQAFGPGSTDVCDETQATERLHAACDSGRTFAILTNVFIGVTAGAAILSGYFYYKAYAGKASPGSSDGATDAPPAPRSAAARWSLTPAASPQGGGMGFRLDF
jgi:hypothetical protein